MGLFLGYIDGYMGESSPCKYLAILAKSGSGIYFWVMGFPSGVFTHSVKIFGAPVLSLETFAIEEMVSFKCPIVLEHNLGCAFGQHVDAKQLSSPTKQSQQ